VSADDLVGDAVDERNDAGGISPLSAIFGFRAEIFILLTNNRNHYVHDFDFVSNKRLHRRQTLDVLC
jgi:hypothetical protein